MNYQDIWDTHAIDDLQRIYSAFHDREGLANAVKRVGLELGANPLEAGESRDRGRRILLKYPLVIWFRVNERMKDVLIY